LLSALYAFPLAHLFMVALATRRSSDLALLLEIGDDGLLLPNGGRVMRDELLLREEAVVSRRAGILNVFDEARQGGSPADRQGHEHGGPRLRRRGAEVARGGEARRERSRPRPPRRTALGRSAWGGQRQQQHVQGDSGRETSEHGHLCTGAARPAGRTSR